MWWNLSGYRPNTGKLFYPDNLTLKLRRYYDMYSLSCSPSGCAKSWFCCKECGYYFFAGKITLVTDICSLVFFPIHTYNLACITCVLGPNMMSPLFCKILRSKACHIWACPPLCFFDFALCFGLFCFVVTAMPTYIIIIATWGISVGKS